MNNNEIFSIVIEVLKKDFYPHLTENIDSNIEKLNEVFNRYCEIDHGKAIHEVSKECHLLELDLTEKFSKVESISGINELINITKSNLIRHKLKYENEQKLGRIILETRLEQLELTKEKIKQEFTSNNQLTGFTCNLHPDTVKEIFNLMVTRKQISGNLTDFQAIFSKVSIPFENPLKWLIKGERGIKSGRGNQTALFVFLELMLGTISNTDLKKCKYLFIDEKGYFIENDLLRPDKDKIKTFGFENQLKEILKKADQPQNQ